MCCDEGKLQAYLDNALGEEEQKEIEKHLASCIPCQQKLEVLRNNQSLVHECLGKYQRGIDKTSFDSEKAWVHFQSHHTAVKENRKEGIRMNKRFKKWTSVASVAVILIGSLSFSSVRSAAAELLTIFRADKVQTIAFNEQDMYDFSQKIRDGVGEIDLEEMGKINVSNETEYKEITREEALSESKFAVKLPDESIKGWEDDFSKVTGTTIDFTLDVKKANEMLTALGSNHLLPQEIDNKTFSVCIGDSIEANYSNENDYLDVMQTKTPEIRVPKDVDIIEVRDALLDIPILPASLKKQLRGVTDIEHTLLIPDTNGNTQEVSVNGKQGVFMEDDNGNYGGLMWLDDGVIRMINGGKLTLQKSLNIASEME